MMVRKIFLIGIVTLSTLFSLTAGFTHEKDAVEKSAITAQVCGDEMDIDEGSSDLEEAVCLVHEAILHKDLDELDRLLEAGHDIEERDRYQNTPLQAAVCQGDKEIVDLLLQKGAREDVVNGAEKTLLHLAALFGHKNLVALFIERHHDINARDGFGSTPLCSAMYAMRNGRGEGEIALPLLLLEKGAWVNVPDHWGGTPLHAAAIEGHKHLVELLISNGAPVNICTKNGLTPQKLARMCRHSDIGDLLAKYERDKEVSSSGNSSNSRL